MLPSVWITSVNLSVWPTLYVCKTSTSSGHHFACWRLEVGGSVDSTLWVEYLHQLVCVTYTVRLWIIIIWHHFSCWRFKEVLMVPSEWGTSANLSAWPTLYVCETSTSILSPWMQNGMLINLNQLMSSHHVVHSPASSSSSSNWMLSSTLTWTTSNFPMVVSIRFRLPFLSPNQSWLLW